MSKRHTIVERLLENATRFADRDAIIAGDRRISYGELVGRIAAVASMLRDEGIGAGDPVVVAAASTASFVFGYFAVHQIGAIAVPVDAAAPDQRIAEIAERTRAQAIFMPRVFEAGAYRARPLDDFELDPVIVPGVGEFSPGAAATADIIFTTGTTGSPKGVMLSHANLCASADQINTFVGNDGDDREVLPLPLSHSFGLGRLRCVMSAGGTLVLVDGFLNVARIFDAIETESATGFSFVPAGLAVLLRLSGDRLGDFAEKLRYIEIGSAPMSMEHKLELIRLLPRTRICMHYGLTEASRSAFLEFHGARDHLDSIGTPSPGVEFRIADESDHEVAPGETGELCVRGAHVMQGYWNAEAETAAVLRGNWLHTGDIGSRDPDGYLHLHGRSKELINVGGRKVIPVEIELALCEHPEVAECACIGVPDPDNISGEAVKAVMVPAGGARPARQALRRFLVGRVEAYKLPTVFEWVDEIPKTASGKVQRQLLKP